MFKNMFIICFFVINLFNNLRCEEPLKFDHIWKKKESEDYTYKHINGYFCRDYKESSYYRERAYVMYDEKYKKGHGTDTSFVLQKYKERLVFALEGFIIEFFGEKKEDVHSELMANEHLDFYYQRRLTELMEYLYFLVKRDNSNVYTWKIPKEFLDINSLKEWDSGKNMSVKLNKTAIKKILCNNANYSEKVSPDDYIGELQSNAFKSNIDEVWKIYYFPGKFNNFEKPTLTEQEQIDYDIKYTIPYKIDVLKLDPANLGEHLEKHPRYNTHMIAKYPENVKRNELARLNYIDDINSMTGKYSEVNKYIEIDTEYYKDNRYKLKGIKNYVIDKPRKLF